MKNTTSFDLDTISSYDSLQKATKARCKHTSREGNIGLTFSIFESAYGCPVKGDWVVRHPDIFDEGAVFEGKCVFVTDYWRVSENEVFSEPMENPTWSDIISECNRQLIDPNDGSTACLFLEGFYELEPKDGCRVFDICWGS